ncbi:MAG: carbohydrate ABC transporter permease [Actinomycetia bacterium]|nr:carbohydrate ABC transporter permease [Actinomycetes bacterium]
MFSFVALAPIVMMLFTALKSKEELAAGPFKLPTEWRWGNFMDAWSQGGFSTAAKASLIVAVVTVVATVVLSVIAGYGFSRFEFRGKRPLFLFLLLGVMLPTEALVIPLFYMFDALGILNTYWALILPQVAQSLAFGTFWMAAFFIQAPSELEDAAAIDGCTPLGTLWRVWVPLAKPAITTLVVLIFMWTWNEFLLALILVQNEAVRTLPVTLSFFQGRYISNVPLLAAAGAMIALPVLILYAFFSRRFIEGVTGGSVKG